MKKMLLGILLLILITAAVSVNSFFVNEKLSELQSGVINSLTLPSSDAENCVKESFQRWEESRRYLRLVISESKLEKISDEFYRCIEKPYEIVLRNKLIYEIGELIESEKMSLQSIF